MARLKNPRNYAKVIADADNKAMGAIKRTADPLILTRNSQLGAMDEEAQVMSVVGMVLYAEEFDTVLYAAPSTQDKMCKRGISQRYVVMYLERQEAELPVTGGYQPWDVPGNPFLCLSLGTRLHG
jgi:hypothetical protein